MRRTISANAAAWLYAFVHFSLEVACFYWLFARVGDNPYFWGMALLYDALAFVPQSIIGTVVDRFPKVNIGLLGTVFVLTALVLPFDIIALIIISIGNAMVHISGAKYTLCMAEGRLTPSSIFVGAGSFGVVTGQLLGRTELVIIPVVLMLISGIIICFVSRKAIVSAEAKGFDIAADMSVGSLLILMFIAVAVRSYIGYAIPTEWNKTVIQSVILFCSMGIGKMLGGVLSDLFGAKVTSLISLIVALPFILFGNSVMILSIVGVAVFNMTMPITLGAIVSKLPEQPCLGFGITTVGLFAGTLPAFFIRPDSLTAHQITVVVLTLIVFIIFMLCLKGVKKNDEV